MTMASAFQLGARQRWPGYTIKGDGQYAVVCPIVQVVTLYDFAMLAHADAGQQHSNWECARHHKLCTVTPLYQPQPTLGRLLDLDD